MRYCLCMYDIDGKLMGMRCFSCSGCGWKHAIELAPCCIRKGGKHGQIIKKNKLFEKFAKKNTWIKVVEA